MKSRFDYWWNDSLQSEFSTSVALRGHIISKSIIGTLLLKLKLSIQFDRESTGKFVLLHLINIYNWSGIKRGIIG